MRYGVCKLMYRESLWWHTRPLGERKIKVVELAGSAPGNREQAIKNAIERAGESLKGLDWFGVKEIRGNIREGKVAGYKVKSLANNSGEHPG